MIKEVQSLIYHSITAAAHNAQKLSQEHIRFPYSLDSALLKKSINRSFDKSTLLSGRILRAAVTRSNKSFTALSVRKQNSRLRNSYRPSSAMAATASDNGDDVGSRTQQSPLASQRAKQNNAPTEANRTGRIGGYFPLGYKEGFSQWVCPLQKFLFQILI